MRKNKKLHFMHLHKTGGTSLFNFLERQFKFNDICPFVYLRHAPDWIPSNQILTDLSDEKIRQYQFFKGHLGWVPRILFSNDEIETITFLREPISRCFSFYNYVKGDMTLWDNIPNRWKSFDDFVFDQEFGLALHSNYQTKSFCADLFFQKSLLTEAPNPYIKSGGVMWAKIDLAANAMLDLAIERLHDCAFVGLTEHYNESFEALCMQYQWLPPSIIPKENVSVKQGHQSDIHPRTLERVRELNALDLQLYEKAAKIYADRKKTRIFFDRSALERTMIIKYPPKKIIKFTFEDKFIGEGWDVREGTPPNLFAWTTGTVSTLIFRIKKTSKFLLSFKVVHTIYPDLHKKLKLTANNETVKLLQYFHPENGLVFEGYISACALKNNNFLKLTFSLPEVDHSIDLHKKNKDTRKLGFALQELEIRPYIIKDSRFKLLQITRALLRVFVCKLKQIIKFFLRNFGIDLTKKLR